MSRKQEKTTYRREAPIAYRELEVAMERAHELRSQAFLEMMKGTWGALGKLFDGHRDRQDDRHFGGARHA